MAGVFAAWQPRYAEHGIPTFPVDLEGTGKKPAVRGYFTLGLVYSRQLVLKFPDNDAFGFALGSRTKLTNLDVDTCSEKALADAFARHGESPIVVRTLRGHFQAWYRHNGERRWIRPWPGLEIDVLGSGFACAPPSEGPAGRYEFIQGGLDDVYRLQPLRNLELGEVANRPEQHQRLIPEPIRNGSLWRYCMRAARHCDDLDTLIDVAMTYARETMDLIGNTHPFTDAEIVTTAESAWGYEITGRNRFGRGGALILGHDLVDGLAASDPDAYALYSILQRHNGGSDEPFMVANVMATETLGGWNRKRLAAARAKLLARGLIEQIRRATSNRAALYRWGGRF